MSFNKIFNQLFDNTGDSSTVLSTGIRSLDRLIDDGFGSELIVVAGRPNHGKTTLLLNLLLNFSYFQEYKGVFIAPRADQKSMTKRLIAMMEDTSRPLENWDENLLLDRMADVKRLFQQKVIVDFGFENLDVVLTKAKESKASYVIIDDFFTIVQYYYMGTKYYIELLNKLNEFVRETKIPIIISMNLTVSTVRRSGSHFPMFEDIHRSDVMLPFIHKVFLLYRESVVGILEGVEGESTENRLELMLKINTRGRTGSLELEFRHSGKIV